MELIELRLERGAVARCSHATGCAQPLAHVLMADEGIRTNEGQLQLQERAHSRPVEQRARPLQPR